MRKMRVASMGLVLLGLAATRQAAYGQVDTAWVGASIPRIDSLFAAAQGPGTPGCELLILRDGHVVYSRGYGMASIELGAPLTPNTVFDIGSVSKQFTAFAILLLEKEGKLSLEDNVRRYVPELPEYASVIRLRHLLYQISGLRDYVELFPLAGVAYQTPVSTEDALAMLARQKRLSFAPGDAWEYSNTNYMLLGLVASRVSGQPLERFLEERVFRPLEMNATHVQTRLDEAVPHKANSYDAAPGGGFSVSYYHWETVGDGAIQSTLSDLARWVANFDTHRIGTSEMFAAMESVGVLNDGSRTYYGMGLLSRRYRGLAVLGHNGSAAGFLTDVERFPEARLSVITSCNCTAMPPFGVFAKVADTLLADRLEPKRPPPGRSLDSLEVDWWSRHGSWFFDERSGAMRRLEVQGGQLVLVRGGNPVALRQISGGHLAGAGGQIEVTLSEQGMAEPPKWIEERVQGGSAFRFSAVQDMASQDSVALMELAGTYSGDELSATWRVRAEGGKVFWKREGLDAQDETLSPIFRDAYAMSFGLVRFERDRSHRVRAMRVWTKGVWGLEQPKEATRSAQARKTRTSWPG